MKNNNQTLINYDRLRELVNEMEQGVAVTTQYAWLDLAHEVLRLHDGVERQRAVCANTADACEMLDTPEARAVSSNMNAVARHLSELLED